MGFPTGEQVFGLPFGETGVVKNEFRFRALFFELESGDGIVPRGPTIRAPRLHDPFVGGQLDMATGNAAPKEREGSTYFGADLDFFASGSFAELPRIGKR